MANQTPPSTPKRVIIEGVGSFMNLFKPRAVKPGDKEFYSLAVLFAKGYDLGPLKALIRACAEKKWGKDESQWPEGFRSPIKLQNPKKYEGHVEGCYFINAKTEQPPGIIAADAVTRITDPSQIFSGCVVKVSVNPYVYSNTGNVGVALGLQNVQLIRHGKPLGGSRIAPELEFSPVEDDEIKGKDASSLI